MIVTYTTCQFCNLKIESPGHVVKEEDGRKITEFSQHLSNCDGITTIAIEIAHRVSNVTLNVDGSVTSYDPLDR